MRPRPRLPLAAGAVVAAVATAGSLWLSLGLGLVPCELCWYQRILMYPLVAVLGVAAALDRPAVALPAPLLAVPGAGVAAAHSWLQWQTAAGAPPGCGVGGSVPCGVVQYRVAGLSVPNLSLLAFVLIWTAMLGAYYLHARGGE